MLGGDIVGSLGYIPVEVSVGSRSVRGAWTANWVIHEKYRGLGAGPLLMRELTRQVDVTLVVGLSAEARALLPRMGFTDYGDLARYVKVIDPDSAAALSENGRPPSVRDVPPRPAAAERAVSVIAVARFGDDAAELWDASLGVMGAGTRRSAEFLNWRYADHPVFGYELFEARTAGRLAGIGVYRIERVRDIGVRVGRVVELMAEPLAVGALVDTLLEHATAHDVAVMDFFCSRCDFTALVERGFVCGEPEADRFPVLFQPIDRRRKGIPFMAYLGQLSEQSRVLRWYVTKGDGEQDRQN